MKYISAEVMEEARLASDLLPWARSAIEEVAQKDGGMQALRHLQGGCKELIEELYPLAIWGAWLTLPDQVVVKPKIGSQNYDAIVTDKRGDLETFYIEVTQAHKGESEHLRRLHLEREGWSPGPSLDMIKIGTKAKGLTVKAGRLLTTLEGAVRQAETLVREAVQRKIRKNYPESTRLLVAFEDVIVVKAESIEQRLRETVEHSINGQHCPFSHIYLVGMSQKLLIIWTAEG